MFNQLYLCKIFPLHFSPTICRYYKYTRTWLLLANFNFIDAFVADTGSICSPHLTTSPFPLDTNEIVLPFAQNLQYLSPTAFCRRVCEFIYLNFILWLPFRQIPRLVLRYFNTVLDNFALQIFLAQNDVRNAFLWLLFLTVLFKC